MTYNVQIFIGSNKVDYSKLKDLGVPKYLINQWLGIQPEKSGFKKPENQVDNKDDISIYSETNTESSNLMSRAGALRKSRFSNNNVTGMIDRQRIGIHSPDEECPDKASSEGKQLYNYLIQKTKAEKYHVII